MAPYPFGVVSLILSTTNLSLKVYTQACSIAAIKIVTHILIGSSIHSFTSGETSTTEIVVLIIGSIVGVLVTIYVTIVFRRILAEVRSKQARYELVEEGFALESNDAGSQRNPLIETKQDVEINFQD